MSIHRGLTAFFMAFFMSLLAACGGGGTDSPSPGPASASTPTLVSIQITPATVNKAVALTEQYTATGIYSSGPNQDITALVTWNSSDASKATINASGLATTIAVGSSTITASLSGITSNAGTLTVSPATLVSIQITPAAITKVVGLTQQYLATGTYSSGPNQDITTSVTWSSATAATATIGARTGLATAAGAGTTNITAALGGVTSNTAVLTVNAATLQSIAITPAASTKVVGTTQQYLATGTYDVGPTQDLTTAVTWNSSTGAASITSAGLATAVAAGNTNITAVFGGVTSNTAALTVDPATLVSIAITPAPTASIALGTTQQFVATGTYSDSTTQPITSSVTWGSSDTGKATIDSNGVATSVATGPTNITARQGTTTIVTSNTAVLTVTAAAITSIVITPATATKVVGFTQQYTAIATFTNSSTQDITATATWSATPTTTPPATIDAAGLATAVTAGTSSIRASQGGANSNIAALTVTANPWTAAGNMSVTRGFHTATVISGGRVLVTGGKDSTFGLPATARATTEIYTISTGLWTAGPAMTGARTNHTATLLNDGSVMVIGGQNGTGPVATAEIFNPGNNTWTAAASLTTARRNHTATLLTDGTVLVTGGDDSVLPNSASLGSTEIYTPATVGADSWAAGPLMGATRTTHTATLLGNGTVLVTGGAGNNGASSEVFTPAAGAVPASWSTGLATMTAARAAHTATLIGSGVNAKVLLTGGFTAAGATLTSTELYDPATNTWAASGAMKTGRALHVATARVNGTVLVTGGYSDVAGFTGISELYDPATGTWTESGVMATGSSVHTATLLSTGRVLVTGGFNGAYLTRAELY